MLREILRSKIHRATITRTALNYQGSIGIDKIILREIDVVAGEKVQVLNFNNGERFETYVIEEEENSGIVALYGPAARRGEVGDEVSVLAYGLAGGEEIEKIKPKIVFLERNNRIKR